MESLPFSLELPKLDKKGPLGAIRNEKKKAVSFASDFAVDDTPSKNAISTFLSQAEELVSQAEDVLEKADSMGSVQDRESPPVRNSRKESTVDKDYLEYSTFAGPHKISAG